MSPVEELILSPNELSRHLVLCFTFFFKDLPPCLPSPPPRSLFPLPPQLCKPSVSVFPSTLFKIRFLVIFSACQASCPSSFWEFFCLYLLCHDHAWIPVCFRDLNAGPNACMLNSELFLQSQLSTLESTSCDLSREDLAFNLSKLCWCEIS